MLQQFKGFIRYSEEEFKELWEKALFVVDTNVLINFYKYTSKESTKSLFDILKKLKENGRLWIPYQVVLEYFLNYENNMNKQSEGYKLLGEKSTTLQKESLKIFSQVKDHYPYISTDKFQFFINDLKATNKTLQEELQKEIDNLPDATKIHKDILELLNGIVGEAYSQQRVKEIQDVGKVRYQYNVPPGFEDMKDKSENDYRTYGGIIYQPLYGDLLVWNQIIDKAKGEGSSIPIIFITEEKKEDWWEKEGRNIKRPQPQLIQEFFDETGENFYMYRTDNFVKFAKKYLNAEVTDEQVENVTKEIESIRRSENKEENNISDIKISDDLIDYLKGVTAEDLMKYLDDFEQEMFINQLRKVFKMRVSQKHSDDIYYDAMTWAVKQCIYTIEDRFKELTRQLANINHEKAQLIINKIQPLPEDHFERGLKLLEHIKFMENELFNKELTF